LQSSASLAWVIGNLRPSTARLAALRDPRTYLRWPALGRFHRMWCLGGDLRGLATNSTDRWRGPALQSRLVRALHALSPRLRGDCPYAQASS
jgi:hypothetical protein